MGRLRFYLTLAKRFAILTQMTSKVSQAAAILGRKGGKVKSKKKTDAARKNAKLPRKRKSNV